jgi:hypothetical protein
MPGLRALPALAFAQLPMQRGLSRVPPGLEAGWRERVGPIRANSATDLLLRRLPGAPVLTAESSATLLGRTFKPANAALQRLVQASVLRQITIGRRNRAYEAPEMIEAFTDLELQISLPV